MKITKTLLKQIIKEELEDMTEVLPGHRTAAPTGAEKEKHEKRQAAREKCIKDAVARGSTQKQAESECKGAGSLEKETTDESVESVDEKVEDIYESLTRRLERLERLIGD